MREVITKGIRWSLGSQQKARTERLPNFEKFNSYTLKVIMSFLNTKDLACLLLVNKFLSRFAARMLRYSSDDKVSFDESNLSESQAKELSGILNKIFIPTPFLIFKLKKLSTGFSKAETYILDVFDKRYGASIEKYFIKISDTEEISREILINYLTGSSGVGPRVEYFEFSPKKIFMTKFIDASCWFDTIRKMSKFKQLAEEIKFMHKELAFNFPENFKANLQFQSHLKQGLGSLPPSTGEQFLSVQNIYHAFRLLDSILLEFDKDKRQLCLCDFNPNNILYDKERFWFIDWELAQIENPYVDISTLATFLKLKWSDELFFLSCYLDRESTELEKAIYLVTKLKACLRIAVASFGDIESSQVVMKGIADQFSSLSPYSEISLEEQFSWSRSSLPLKVGISMIKEAYKIMSSKPYRNAVEVLSLTSSEKYLKFLDLMRLGSPRLFYVKDVKNNAERIGKGGSKSWLLAAICLLIFVLSVYKKDNGPITVMNLIILTSLLMVFWFMKGSARSGSMFFKNKLIREQNLHAVKKIGRLIFIAGHQGVGKTTLIKSLVFQREDIVYAVPYTTRKPKTGEIEGVDRIFLDEKTLRSDKDVLLIDCSGYHSGVRLSEIIKIVKSGRDAVVDIGHVALSKVIDYLNSFSNRMEVIKILILPESKRGDEFKHESMSTETSTFFRSASIHPSIRFNQYDYVVVNKFGKVKETVSEIMGLLRKSDDSYISDYKQ